MSVEEPISQLIDKYKRETGRRDQSEADVRANYIDWLFHYLGWDVWKENPHPSNGYHREGYQRGAGYVDVGLEIAGEPVLMLEAKRFGALPRSAERTYDRTPEEKQLFRYAHRGKKIPYCILTNFERLHVFNADHEVLILSFDNPTEYLDRLDELQRLSPDKVKAGSLQDWERKREIKPVDKEFLTSLQDWRLRLANTIYEHNPSNSVLQSDGSFDFGKLMAAVQRILDRLILIRYADDREVLKQYDILHNIVSSYHNLGAYSRHDHLTRAFIELSHSMDSEHNTTLFEAGHPCEQVSIPNEVLASIITEMNNISFRKFTSDILGNTYETYLGTKLALKNGEIKSEERRDIRKAGGIFYTPTFVVHYIIDNTLGQLLKELESQHGLQAIEKAKEIRVLDPACGSGSFLIYAYQVLADFYRRMNEAIGNEQVRLLASGVGADMFARIEQFKHLPKPLENYPHHILEKQLYGVDIDPEAAEIAAVNLTMQAFADTKREKLPLILNENIKVGNSLISGADEELKKYFGDNWREKKPFNWEEEFKDIMAQGGFDVVIGNPPYVRTQTLDKSEVDYFKQGYVSATGHYDIYVLFLEHALSLLRQGGRLGFILPSKFFQTEYGRGIRNIISQEGILEQVVNFGSQQVFEKSTTYTCLLFLKKEKKHQFKYALVKRLYSPEEQLAKISSQEQYDSADLMVDSIEMPPPSGQPWLFTASVTAGIVQKLLESSMALGDMASHIFVGPQTDADKVFILTGPDDESQALHLHSKSTNTIHTIERASVMPLLSGQDVKQYGFPQKRQWLIFPYEKKGAKVVLIPPTKLENLYPRCFEYLSANRALLEARPRLRSPAERWVAFGQEKNLSLQRQPKLCVPRLCRKLTFLLDETGQWCQDNVDVCGVILKEEGKEQYCFVLGLLNSRVMDFYFRQISVPFRGGFYSANRQFLEPLPIRRIDFDSPTEKKIHDDLVALVDRMLELNKRLAPIRNTPSSEQEELLREIKRTDAEIDQKVYELYGLTEEERQVIEGSVNKS